MRQIGTAGIIILVASLAISGVAYLGEKSFEWTPSNPGFIYSFVFTLGFFILIGAGLFGAIKGINEFLIAAGTATIVLTLLNKLFSSVMYSWGYLDAMWLIAGVMMILDSLYVKRVKEARMLEEAREELPPQPTELIQRLDMLVSGADKSESIDGIDREKDIYSIKKPLWIEAQNNPQLVKDLRFRLYQTGIVQGIVRRLVDSYHDVIEPTIEISENPTYTGLENLGEYDQKRIQHTLNELVDSGVLLRDLYEKLIGCPSCHKTSRVFQRNKCPKCDSYKVTISRLIQHLECGAISTENEYVKPEGAVCPKCEKTIDPKSETKPVGVVFGCESCASTFSDPNKSFYCRKCSLEFQLKDCEFIDIYSYSLNNDIKNEAREALTVLAIASKIEKLGFKVDFPGSLTGRSGVSHQFTLTCNRNDKLIALDFVMADKEVDTKTVLSSYAKFMDINVTKKLLIAMPKLERQARDFLNTNRVQYFEAENAEEAFSRMRQQLE